MIVEQRECFLNSWCTHGGFNPLGYFFEMIHVRGSKTEASECYMPMSPALQAELKAYLASPVTIRRTCFLEDPRKLR